MKSSMKLWHGLTSSVARAGVAAVASTALLPAAFAGQSGEGGEGGKGAKPAAQGKDSAFLGDIDKAVSNIFIGEGGEGGAGLSPMWPSVTIPALSSSDIEKVVTGNTLRTPAHVAWYFTPEKRIEGGYVDWRSTDQSSCPAKEVPNDVFHRGTDGVCYTYKLHPSKGTWSVKNNQLCLDVKWETGTKSACRYVAILLDDIALFDEKGKIDGKGMKLLKGRALAE